MMIRYAIWMSLVAILFQTVPVYAGVATQEPIFYNTSPRVVRSSLALPRVVTNVMATNFSAYIKNGGTNWGDFPTDTAQITWGNATPTFTCTNVPGSTERVFATFTFPVISGRTYLVSFYVDSKTGTHVNGTVGLFGVAFTGDTEVTSPAVGRHVFRSTASANGTVTVRMGVGINANNTNAASITISKVQVEIALPTTRAYPYEYVNPGDSRAFPYTFTASPTGTAVGAETLGSVYAVERTASVLVLGDSFTNDNGGFGGVNHDWPFYLRERFGRYEGIAVSSRGVAGERTTHMITQLANALAASSATYTTGVRPWGTVILPSSVNDVSAGISLAQLQSERLQLIASATSAGLLPILTTICPWNGANGTQNTFISDYNTWIKTLGYAVYDCFADATDGSNQFKTDWGSGDGLHPGTGYNQGAFRYADRIRRLLMLVR